MDTDKVKRTFYLTQEANRRLNTFVSINLAPTYSAHGAYSDTVNHAVMNYCSVTPAAMALHMETLEDNVKIKERYKNE